LSATFLSSLPTTLELPSTPSVPLNGACPDLRGALDCSLFVSPDLQLSTFDFQPHLSSKSFNCNTYGSPRKCCKQKTYCTAKPFRCNTYKKHRGPLRRLDIPTCRRWYAPSPFIFFILQTHRHDDLESTPLQSIRRALFSSRRMVYPLLPILTTCLLFGARGYLRT
jgi:hypothetical protein